MAVLDIPLTFSDNRIAMLGSNGKYVYERALLVLAEAAARLGIRVDIDTYRADPPRRRVRIC